MASTYPKYDYFYWCTQCQKWIPKDKAERNKKGYPICPSCHKRVRMVARHYKRKTSKDYD
ncbi:hypothetical protein J7K06_06995 [Candidatus Bathyarchaeota archaeon]|nr:hypothetical protein [Candidatus Bathyarchaeota archaeon]